VATIVRLGDRELIRIGLGTNRLRKTDANVELIGAALAAGVELIDTAHTYTGGESEATIGEALSPGPADGLVATKGGWDGARPEVLHAEIEESLRRLGRDTIDLYYLHRPDPETPLEESLAAIDEYRRSGKIRHVGVSNVGVEQVERARQVVSVAAVQNHYNLAERKHEDVVDYCEREDIVFVPYFPLRGEGPPAVAEIAERHGVTRSQIALAWLLRRSQTILPIPGTLSPEHLRENVAALEIELTDDEFEALG